MPAEFGYANTMNLERFVESGVTTIAISGDIDLLSAPALREVLQDCVRDRVPQLLLDCTATTYMDSSGLASLIEYYKESTAFGGKFALYGLNERIRSLLELVRLDSLFLIGTTRSDALQKLGLAE